MSFEIIAEAKELENALDNATRDMPRMLDAAVLQATKVLYHESIAEVTKLIYNVPIPVSKTGKPRWRRTHNLVNNERFQFHRLGSISEGRIYNNAKTANGFSYAQWRENHVYPTGADGVNRTAPWRDLTVQNKGSEALSAFDGAFNAELKERGL
jgi:hypothetical protein